MQDLIATRPANTRLHSLLELVVVVAVLAAMLSAMTVDQAVGAGWGPKLFVLARMAVLVLLCTWMLRRGGERWADVGLRRPPRWWSVPLLVGAGFAVFIAIAIIANPLLAAIGVEQPRIDNAPLQGDLLEYLYWAVPVSWGSAAFGEEMLLRGFILDRIAKLIGSARTPAMLVAVILQAALFGTLHFNQGLGGVLVTGTIGVLFGLMWLVGGRNLWACIILHGIINSISHYESYAAVAG